MSNILIAFDCGRYQFITNASDSSEYGILVYDIYSHIIPQSEPEEKIGHWRK